jgi:hypothetical protein
MIMPHPVVWSCCVQRNHILIPLQPIVLCGALCTVCYIGRPLSPTGKVYVRTYRLGSHIHSYVEVYPILPPIPYVFRYIQVCVICVHYLRGHYISIDFCTNMYLSYPTRLTASIQQIQRTKPQEWAHLYSGV